MAKWEYDRKEYGFTPIGARQETEVLVSGAHDSMGTQKNQFIIEDAPGNRGRSIFEPGVLGQCIERLSKAMYEMDPEKRDFFEMDPKDQQWHVRANDGQLYSVDLSFEEKTVNHPQVDSIKRMEDLNHDQVRDLKKVFPDVKVTELTTSLERLEAHQEHEVKGVFQGLEDRDPLMYQDGPERDDTSGHDFDLGKEKLAAHPQPESAHEIDLSQEQF